MRAKEFIVEAENTEKTDSNLLTVLDSLRNRYMSADEEDPKIRVDSLINMVRSMPGSEMFNAGTLISAYDNDPALKNIVRAIKKDDSGVRYIYLKPNDGMGDQEFEEPDTSGGMDSELDTEKIEAERTVDQMSKRALKKRK
jgi:hypothetical protein